MTVLPLPLLLAPFGLGTTELLLILAIVVLVFGASRIPQLGRSLGEGIRSFKRGVKDDDEPTDAPAPVPPGKTPEPR